MSKLAHFIAAVALALAAHASIPGWSPAVLAASPPHKCTSKTHHHAKVGNVKLVAAKPAVRGGGGAQMRRSPDVQILSFGP